MTTSGEQVLSSQAMVPAVMQLVDAINANRELLSEIDGAIGDGDHGINMSTGFTRFRTEVGDKHLTLAATLTTLGTTLLEVTGGSLGPLYGSMFLAMGETAESRTNLDSQTFLGMLESGRDTLSDIGGAKPGDKTLLDSLCPAIDAYRAQQQAGASFVQCLQALSQGAEEGKESTRQMVARVGRASRLGERSRGVLDAGAVSCFIILTTLSNALQQALAQATR